MLQYLVAVAGGATESGSDLGSMILAQGEDAARGFGGLTADAGYAAQEEGQPAFPVAAAPSPRT